ncbi:MAG TPA: ATP-binding cassette domain-containing protein [Candidatus Xenobia bacterium]|nr:ATP-binding cassette domain-containing protein [Candidatus Xenobia bacterium]
MIRADNYIEFDRVSKSFWLADGSRQEVLHEVSFFVPRRETVAILGRSGVGKSVTLKHIVGFLRPDSGRVYVEGRDVSDLPEEQWAELRRRMALVFQSGALFDSLSVAENVAFPLRESAHIDGRQPDEEAIEKRVRELLETVDLEDYAEAFPADLSTGLRRAVAIARALASEPDCILYDEPTTNVDPLMAQTITGLILRLKEKFHITSIVVTHDVRLAERVADRLVMLHEGRVAFFGTPEEWQRSDVGEVERFRALDALPGATPI